MKINIDNLSYDNIKNVYEKMGYKFYDNGKKYNVNLFGIRSKDMLVNEWNDILGVAYLDEFGKQNVLLHKGTTKPGYYYLKKKKGNVNGTAILIPNQYPHCWSLGLHNGKYKALRQVGKPFEVWRDDDSDGELDYSGKIYKNVTGLNMHTESLINKTEKVGAYSAGCQVREFDKEHFMVIELIERSAELYGNKFTYTLFEEKDFEK